MNTVAFVVHIDVRVFFFADVGRRFSNGGTAFEGVRSIGMYTHAVTTGAVSQQTSTDLCLCMCCDGRSDMSFPGLEVQGLVI